VSTRSKKILQDISRVLRKFKSRIRFFKFSYLTFGAKIYVASSNAQLLDRRPTDWAVILFHVWAHGWRVATLVPIEIQELVP